MRKLLVLTALLGVMALAGTSEAGFRLSSYAGRYACRECSGSCFFTTSYVVSPDGAGFYFSGTQTVYGADSSFPSAGCSYTLDFNATYTINPDGTGSETLIWDPVASNSPGCPGSYTDTNSIVLYSTSGRTQVAGNNLGNEEQPGLGECSK